MSGKSASRLRRARRVRAKIRQLEVNRLCVFRTPRHIYAQVIAPDGAHVLASASTAEKEVRSKFKHGGNTEAAKLIGQRIATRAKDAGITQVAFDRSGYKYHGRIKALADAAREHGLQF
ncbi:MAG: 50S ribosomal protein L18 [Gammaproteobacteria bacterium]|nr:50S ribosomal protein L18 [Gammaproteobacteria bacterium]